MPTPRLLLPSLVIALAVAALGTRAQTLPNLSSNSAAIEWDSLRVNTNATGSQRKLFDSPTATLNRLEGHITVLNPGQASHPPHHHPEEEVVIIREGTVEALINGEWKRVGPGSIVFNACNVTHDLRNVGTNPAVYHVFMWRSAATPGKTDHPDTVESSKTAPATNGVMGALAMDWNTVPVITNATGFSRKFFEAPTPTADLLEFHATTVNPGQSSHAPSAHDDSREELIVIREGTVEAYVNGDWKRLGPGSVIINAAHAMQAVRNVGATPATYFVLMWKTKRT